MQNKDFIKEIEQEIIEFNSTLNEPTDKVQILEQVRALSIGENEFYKQNRTDGFVIYTKKPRFKKVGI